MDPSKHIPAKEFFDRWDKDPEFRREYDALEGEIALVRLFIEARARADLTQEQVAEGMGTTQA